MPYIIQEERDFLAEGNSPETPGQVNYLVSLLMNAYFENYDDANDIATEIEYVILDLYTHGTYTPNNDSEFSQELADIISSADVDISEIIGALRNAHLEFYVRQVCPYEEKKIKENGDIVDEAIPV